MPWITSSHPSLTTLEWLGRSLQNRLRISTHRLMSLVVVMQLFCPVSKNFSLVWLPGLTPYLTKPMKVTRMTFSTTSPLFTSLPMIEFMKFLPIEIETTMRWLIPVLFPQCYHMSLSSYLQPTSSERFGNMLSDLNIVTYQHRSISLPTSTKPWSMLTDVSQCWRMTLIHFPAVQVSRMARLYLVFDSRIWWNIVVSLQRFFLEPVL
jgi:hypothetical protein